MWTMRGMINFSEEQREKMDIYDVFQTNKYKRGFDRYRLSVRIGLGTIGRSVCTSMYGSIVILYDLYRIVAILHGNESS